MIKYILYLVAGMSCHILFCCTRPANDQLSDKEDLKEKVFNLKLNHYNERSFRLSETCETVEYVILETTKTNFIGSIMVIKVSDNFIILTDDATRKVHAFTRQGLYLFEIAKRGKGPGEYNQVDDIIIDEENQCVYLKSGRNILEYSLDNKYQKTIKLEVFPRYISKYQNGFVSIVEFPSTMAYSGYTFNFQNEDGKLLDQKVYHDLDSFNGQELRAFATLYTVNDTLCYWEAYYDTVYSLTYKGHIAPRWTFNYSKNHITKAEMSSMQELDKASRTRFYISKFIETPKHVFVKAGNSGFPTNLIFDKEKNEYIISSIKGKYGEGIIENDIDGIIEYWPMLSVGSNTTAMVIDPLDFKQAIEKVEINSGNKQIIEQYGKKVTGISQFDNQVLVIVTHI